MKDDERRRTNDAGHHIRRKSHIDVLAEKNDKYSQWQSILVDVTALLQPFSDCTSFLRTLTPGQIDQTDLADFLTRNLTHETHRFQIAIHYY